MTTEPPTNREQGHGCYPRRPGRACAASDATADCSRPHIRCFCRGLVEGEETLIYIENEGAIFKGSSRSNPEFVRNHGKREWVPYTGKVPKPVEWGDEISDEEALRWIEEAEGHSPRTVGEGIELDPWKYDDYDGPRSSPRPDALAHLDLRARKAAEAAAKRPGKDFGSA